MERQPPTPASCIDSGIALEDLVRDTEFLEVLGQKEATDACTDDENGKISHDGGSEEGTDVRFHGNTGSSLDPFTLRRIAVILL